MSATANQELQDMVVDLLGGNAAKEPQDERPLTERLQTDAYAEGEVILVKGRELEGLLQTADPEGDETEIRDRVADWAVLISRERLPQERVGWEPLLPNDSGHGEAFFHLHDYLRQRNEETLLGLYRFVRGYNNQLECRQVSEDRETALLFLQARWGEETAQRLSEITRVSKATSQKWLEGSHPSLANLDSISQIVALVYTLEEDCRMGEEGAEQWLYAPNSHFENKSPWQHIANTSYWRYDIQPALEDAYAQQAPAS